MFRIINISIALFISNVVSAEMYWQDKNSVENTMLEYIVPGSIEKDSSKRAICRTYNELDNQLHMGKVVSEKCHYSLNLVDESRKAGFLKRVTFQNYSSSDYEVLMFDDSSDFAWVDKNETSEELLFDGGEEENAPLYICRAKNYTIKNFSRTERGIHSGQLYGQFKNGTCFYEYGGKGQTSDDGNLYTNNQFEVLIVK